MPGDLRARGVKFHPLTGTIDTKTPTGRVMWQTIGALSELQRSLSQKAPAPV
jgi:DNA invertase Pin-like site-specific DNA recombinase